MSPQEKLPPLEPRPCGEGYYRHVNPDGTQGGMVKNGVVIPKGVTMHWSVIVNSAQFIQSGDTIESGRVCTEHGVLFFATPEGAKDKGHLSFEGHPAGHWRRICAAVLYLALAANLFFSALSRIEEGNNVGPALTGFAGIFALLLSAAYAREAWEGRRHD